MLTTNMCAFDRIVRIVMGTILLILFVAIPSVLWRWLLLLGIYFIGTGVVGVCPAYNAFGWTTVRAVKQQAAK